MVIEFQVIKEKKLISPEKTIEEKLRSPEKTKEIE